MVPPIVLQIVTEMVLVDPEGVPSAQLVPYLHSNLNSIVPKTLNSTEKCALLPSPIKLTAEERGLFDGIFIMPH